MEYNWKQLLSSVSLKLLETADPGDLNWLKNHERGGEKVLSEKWFGYPGATEAQITQAEARLGKSLPPDYRQFLVLTNGWRNFRHYPFGLVSLLPVEGIDWFMPYDDRKRMGRIEEWLEWKAQADPSENDDEPPESHFRATLIIGESDGNECFLLNPLVIDSEGEWEAWIYHKEIGVRPYDSFWQLMESHTRLCVDDLDNGRWWHW